MHGNSLIQLFIYLAVLLLLAKPIGIYMARIYEGIPAKLNVWLLKIENGIYKISGVKKEEGMTWKSYAAAVLLLNGIGILFVFVLQKFQNFLPLNPQNLPNIASDLSFNTAVSFVTNTNWQSYSGEATMSYLTQMIGLSVQNFCSAATGMAVLVAFIRGFTQKQNKNIGNFWVDFVRSILYILLPLSLLFSIFLGSQGVPQTFKSGITATTLENEPQFIVLGPVASQISIKQLGTNGGGFFGTNSAHPFENPTPFSNFLEMMALLLIPMALCFTFGALVKNPKQGQAIFFAMCIILIPAFFFEIFFEQQVDPKNYPPHEINQDISALQTGGNMEGKESRFGIASSAIWSIATTAASNGSVNSLLDSYSPLGGLIPLWLIQLGGVVFGGVGSGLYGMLAFVIIAVFIAGLMIGRTPEYLGKKIEVFEIKMVSFIILLPIILVLLGSGFSVLYPPATASILNPGAHGLTEILYAFSSAGNNNGSAFAGLSTNTIFYNIFLGIIMLLGRFGVIFPILAIAGSLSQKKAIPETSGTLPTHTPLFIIFLVMVVLVIGALSFFPALALGPIAEYLMSS